MHATTLIQHITDDVIVDFRRTLKIVLHEAD